MLTINEIGNIDWKKVDNMLPAIAQHYISGEILMFGYMNKEAYLSTIEKKLFTLFSRKKNRLWVKGESSKNFLYVKQVTTDCDSDAVLVKVKPSGNTCHLNTFSCFKSSELLHSFLYQLEDIIKLRKKKPSRDSYISNLFSLGRHRIAQKLGEESIETIISFLEKNSINLVNEASDLLFHFLILLQYSNINLKLVIKNLKKRAQ